MTHLGGGGGRKGGQVGGAGGAEGGGAGGAEGGGAGERWGGGAGPDAPSALPDTCRLGGGGDPLQAKKCNIKARHPDPNFSQMMALP